MRKGEATRIRVLEEAARQAAVRGLAAVSLADVADAAGISKSGLIKYFGSKDGLHLAVLQTVAARFAAFTWSTAEPLPAGRPRLEQVFERWLDWGDTEWAESGCPLNAFSVELDDQPGPLQAYLRESLLHWRNRLVREFEAVGDPPLSQAEAKAAYFEMKSFVLGSDDARRMMGDADARRSASAAFRALLVRVSGARAALSLAEDAHAL